MKNRKLSIVLAFAMVVLLFCVSTPAVSAADIVAGGTDGNLTWKLYDDGLLTINGTGVMPNWNWNNTPWNNYLTSIKTVVISDGVTTVGNSAFNGCDSLTSVTVPSSVTDIGYAAFAYCRSLTSVTIPSNVTAIGESAFYGCGNLTSVTIPEKVTTIGNSAFYGCVSLTNVIIPEKVTTIGESAFAYCRNLTSVTVDTNNLSYSSLDGVLFNKEQNILIYYPGGKTGNYTIPSSVTVIGEYAFYGCNVLIRVAIPSSVTAIRECAFYNCRYLTSAYFLGNAPTNLGDDVFSNTASGGFTIYYYEGKTGWSAPMWNGYKTEMIPVPKTITFNANGGNVTPMSAETDINGKLSTLPTPTRGGYIFDGWFTQSSGGTKVTTAYVFTSDTTVYAQWIIALDKIEITSAPNKLIYIKGETLDLAGIAVTATYSDKSTKAVTGFTANPANGTVLNTVGTQAVTVSYTENSVTQNVTFNVTVRDSSPNIIYGDVNGNGSVDINDLVTLAQHIAEVNIIKDTYLLANADVNGDGKVNIADLIRLSRWLAGDKTPLGQP